ncbi:AMP-binding protein [Micromonospora sp. NPDC047074]|uniref:AMP-binding protein n=1 Tax=Micromonospora sp. NPDC047074 TaxID=3154339 RepID=UPI0033FFBFBA
MEASTTLWEIFRRSLITNADRPALGFGDETWTYAELGRAVAAAAARLAALGVRPGERVILLTDNVAAFPVHDLAVMSLGAVKVPLNAMISTPEVTDIARRVRPRVAVVSRSLAERVAGIPTGAGTAVVDADLPLAYEGEQLPPPGAAGPDDPAVIYFTGGTTGAPKGIVHSQRGVVANLWAHLLDADIRRDERLLLTTPLAHAAGLFTLSALLRGAYARIEPGFDADRVLDRVDQDGTTWTFAVPTTIYRLLDAAEARGWRPGTLRTVQYGAAPIAAGQLRRALAVFGPVLQQLYAQTESPNYATLLRKEDHVRALAEPGLLASCGRASIMCDVAVLDDAGNPQPPGATGEVAVRSPYVMTGYWEDPEGAAKRFVDGWLLTGDIGYQDEQSYLYLVDRRNDMIVSGGMNVYSIEVEQALARHPGVRAAAVVGLPHADWGEAVHAYVVPRGDFADTDGLRTHCRETLSAYKRPKAYHLVPALPTTPYGKVDKKALRASGATVGVTP